MNRMRVQSNWLSIVGVMSRKGVLHVCQRCVVVHDARAVCSVPRDSIGLAPKKTVDLNVSLTAKDPSDGGQQRLCHRKTHTLEFPRSQAASVPPDKCPEPLGNY
jgi:hypothetical protein